MLDVIGIGSCFVDYFFDVDKKTLDKYNLKPEDDFLFKDITISPKDIFEKLSILRKSPGGISLNTIAVLGALNMHVAYYGVVGSDKDGDYFIEKLNKVDKSYLIRSGNMSRCTCLLSHSRKYRTFLSEVNPRDNDFFKNINYDFLNTSKFIYVGPFLADPKKNLKKLEKIFVKINKPLIGFSPSILYINLGFKALLPLIKKTYILFLNKQEIKKLVNKNAKDGSKYLLKYGPKIIVCTMGKEGAIVTTSKEQIFQKGKKIENVVDTTGAGDSFAAGFLCGLIKEKSLNWSLSYANKIASRSVSDFGLSWLSNKF